jgi:hypothetical protein
MPLDVDPQLDPLARKVASRFRQRMADQPPGQRKKDNQLTKPINSPKGINRQVIRDNVQTEDTSHDDTVKPNRRDIQPADVFTPKPRNMNVRNLAETGKDQDKALRNQVPKDKGWDTVRNLSQYLVRTEGGGDTPAVGGKRSR